MVFVSGFLETTFCSTGGVVVLTLVGLVGWSTVYVYAIYLGFKEKTYCIPWVSLCINYAWELFFSFTPSNVQGIAQRIINIVWALLDTVIMYTLIKFGFKYFKPVINKWMWYIELIFVFLSGLTWIIMFQSNIDPSGGIAAFADNYLMSILFISLYFKRKSLPTHKWLEGQSIVIAISKFLGTLANSIGFGMCSDPKHDAPEEIYMYIMITLLDMYYIGLIIHAMTVINQDKGNNNNNDHIEMHQVRQKEDNA